MKKGLRKQLPLPETFSYFIYIRKWCILVHFGGFGELLLEIRHLVYNISRRMASFIVCLTQKDSVMHFTSMHLMSFSWSPTGILKSVLPHLVKTNLFCLKKIYIDCSNAWTQISLH